MARNYGVQPQWLAWLPALNRSTPLLVSRAVAGARVGGAGIGRTAPGRGEEGSLGKGGAGVVVVLAHHGAAALGERAVGDGRRITSDAGHWPAEAERAAGTGAAEEATGAGL